jgi:DNA-binding transcriptional ArsR family regulator
MPAALPLDDQSRVFAALGDPTRLSVLSLVGETDGPTATSLAGQVGVSRPAVVKHLRVLEGAGLVTREKQGRDVRFHVEAATMAATADWLEKRAAAWGEQLASLKRLAEQTE